MTKKYLASAVTAFLLGIGTIFAQESITLKGKVLEKDSDEPLTGVNITIKDRLIGTISDTEGNFTLTTKTPLPFILVFSIVGFELIEQQVTRPVQNLEIQLKEQTLIGQEVVVSASRVEENIIQSPVSIEKLGLLEIQQNSTANFYDGLYQLKGVDMNVNSLTFRFPNTRGFSGEANYRMNQLVDGIENVSPGLSFAAGNMFGLSELDVESVELLIGASSALYGPGGMNGTLLMTSKNPFEYQGLSATLQTGVMHVGADYDQGVSPMIDASFRYAKVVNEKFAFKITGSYLTATDWHASDFRDRTDLNDPSLTRESNPGYDGVNVYGDDIIVPVNLKEVAPGVAAAIAETQGIAPGTPEYDALYNNVVSKFPDQVISRTGWNEKYMADYNTTNFKTSAALHYRIHEKLEATLQGSYNNGTSLYTSTNRFAIRDFDIGFGKLEIKSPDFFVRSYAILEETGESFDVGGAGLRMNEAWKPSQDWYADYIGSFAQSVLLGGAEDDAHEFARMVADNRDKFGNVFTAGKPALPLPGTDEFNTLLDDISTTSVTEGGTKVIDQSKLWHIEGMYDFSRALKLVDLIVGASYRIFWVDSRGTVFYDEPGQPVKYNIFGAYAQLSKAFWNERFKMALSARYDKHQKFDGEFTPRASIVYSLDPKKEHNIRMSYQTAFRFPSTSDQWIDFNTGYYIGVGGLPEVQNSYNFNTNPVYPLSGANPITDVPVVDDGPFVIPQFGPEKVKALELGYKGLNFNKMLFVDAYVYKNEYTGFLANILLAQNPFTPEEQRYQTVISTTDNVSSMGWAVGADLNLKKGYYLKGNIAYNKLESETTQTGQQNRYNTPDYRFNVGFGNREILKNLGFHVSYRWQNEFLWESNFGVANMPAFGSLDANVAVKVPSIKTMVKVGGSNLLNDYYTTSFGSAQVGGLYYVSLMFNEFLN
ncbi:MAG: TonB-dependent receptor [Cyclobacteriaceae bacterium]|nr:TonB-dependent receptor [Cyclobacteriaceae bacterium]